MKKKAIFTIIVFMIMVGVGIFLLGKMRASDQRYESEIVTLGNVSKTVNVDATIQPKTYIDVSTEIPTLIKWVGVDVGDYVKNGQEILRLDKDSISAQIRNAQLAVERAELTEQQGRLKSSHLSSKQILSLKKASEQARQALQEVYAQAKKTSIYSTIDGVVIKQTANAGEVASGILMRIIDPKSLRIEALVPEVDISKIQIGNIAYIKFDAYPEKIMAGKVEAIEMGNINLQNNTYYKTIVAMDNINDIVILDGMNAELDIESKRKENVLIIPRNFAVKDEDGYFVYILNTINKDKKTPVKQYFEIGIVGDKDIEVAKGLSEGQEIMRVTKAVK